MGFLKKVGKAIEKVGRQCRKLSTTAFTHGPRNQIEHQYQEAMIRCAQSQQEALSKLHAQYEAEYNKIAVERKQLEESLKNNQEQFRIEQAKITQHLEDKEKALKEAFEAIKKNFKGLRAAFVACKSGNEEEINKHIKPVLERNAALKARFLALNPLHIAAANNDDKLIELLCRQGADIYSRNEEGKTPIDIAEEGGCEAASQAFKDILRETAVFWEAVEAGDEAAMKASLERGAAINTSLRNGHNILQQVIIDKKPYKLIRCLVEAGADCRYASPFPEIKESAELKSVAETREDLVIHIDAIILKKEGLDWDKPSLEVYPSETKEAMECKDIAEARESSKSVPKAIVLAQEHSDWRVRDFLINYFRIEVSNCFSLDWKSSLQEASNIDGHSPFNFKFPSLPSKSQYIYANWLNPQHLFSFVTIQGRKQFFVLNPFFHGFHVVTYDFSRKKWQSYSLSIHTPEKPDRHDSFFWRNKGRRWSHDPGKLQIMRTEAGEEQLFLLTSANDYLVIWQYKPDVKRWVMSRPGPKRQFEKHGIIHEDALCAGKKVLFYLRKKLSQEGKMDETELWHYNPNRDEWLPEGDCPITKVWYFQNKVVDLRPQIITLEMNGGEERLFVFLVRLTSEVIDGFYLTRFELWSYEPKDRSWTPPKLHSPWMVPSHWTYQQGKCVFTHVPKPVIHMQKVTVKKQSKLFFLEFNVNGMSLWEFNPNTPAWIPHLGGPSWRRAESLSSHTPPFASFTEEPLNLVQMQTVPSYEEDTDIILFFKQSFQSGIECYAYHPVNKKWASFSIPGLSEQIWSDKDDRMQICVEQIEKQYHLMIFEKRGKEFEKPTELWTCPLNIMALERTLRDAPEVPAPLSVFSELEFQNASLFLEMRDRASQAFLASVRRGDWLAVFDSLQQGADIHATEEEGCNALQLALRHQSLDLSTLQRLLKAGLAVRRPMLELARGQGLIDVHNYLATLLDKPILRVLDVETQFKTSYLRHLDKAQSFLDRRPDDIQKCQAILSYYRLLSSSNPYAIYVWPGMLLLGEILLLPAKDLESRPEVLSKVLHQIQTFFMKTRAVHRALIEVGVQHSGLLEKDPEFDWRHVINSIRLREASEEVEAKTQEETLSMVYHQHADVLLEGTRAAVSGFMKALRLKKSEREKISQWVITQQQCSPYLLREYCKTQFHLQFESLASIAREASELELLALPPKLSLAPMMQALDQEEQLAKESIIIVEQAFVKEKEELAQWLTGREAAYLTCIRELEKLIADAHGMDAKLRAESQRATSDINAQFANFRRELENNKANALHKVQSKAFTSLVVMGAACFVAYAAGPALASAIGGTAGLSGSSIAILEKVLQGAIMGGINGGFARENVALAALKGAGFAAIGIAASAGVGQVASNAPRLFQVAMARGIEAGIRSGIEGGGSKSITTAIGTGLLVEKMKLPEPKSFMETLRNNLLAAFMGGSVHAAVTRQDLGSCLAASAVTATICTGAEVMGTGLAAKFKPSSVEHSLAIELPSAVAAAVVTPGATGVAAAGAAVGLGVADALSIGPDLTSHSTGAATVSRANSSKSLASAKRQGGSAKPRRISSLNPHSGAKSGPAGQSSHRERQVTNRGTLAEKPRFTERPRTEMDVQRIPVRFSNHNSSKSNDSGSQRAETPKSSFSALGLIGKCVGGIVGIGTAHAADETELLRASSAEQVRREHQKDLLFAYALEKEYRPKGLKFSKITSRSSASGDPVTRQGEKREVVAQLHAQRERPFSSQFPTSSKLGERPLFFRNPFERNMFAGKLVVEVIDGRVGHARIGISRYGSEVQYYGFAPDNKSVLQLDCRVQKEKPAGTLGKKSTSVTLNLSEDQLGHVYRYIIHCQTNPQSYLVYGNNCKDWVNNVLKVAGRKNDINRLISAGELRDTLGEPAAKVFKRF